MRLIVKQMVLALAVLSANGAAAVDWPRAALPASAAAKVDSAQFLPISQLRDWQADLDQRGLRATGSPAHEQYVDALRQRLAAAGVQQLHFENATFQRWSTDSWSLEVIDGAEPGRVEAASYIPYSGVTPPQGVSAPMVYLPPGQKPDASMAGKIVVVEIPRLATSMRGLLAQSVSRYDPEQQLKPDAPYVRPYIYLGAVHALETALEAVGAAGMVAITDSPHTYIPYDRELHRVPGLFVDTASGARLKRLAQHAVTLKLTLPARVETVSTRNLIGIIPGASDELMVIHSHTDGTNGIEDNGPNAVVDIAQYLARLPRQALPRGVMVMLSAGHFAGGIGIEGFLRQHADDGLLARIGAIVTVEHLGAQEWLPDAAGKLAPTGKFEPAALFMPNIPALLTAARTMQQNADARASFISLPTNPQGKGTPNDAVWPGEGQYFWGYGRIPTINYISGPYYLLDWGPHVSTADKVDFARLHRETVAFTQMLLDLSRITLPALRGQ